MSLDATMPNPYQNNVRHIKVKEICMIYVKKTIFSVCTCIKVLFRNRGFRGWI